MIASKHFGVLSLDFSNKNHTKRSGVCMLVCSDKKFRYNLIKKYRSVNNIVLFLFTKINTCNYINNLYHHSNNHYGNERRNALRR